MVKNKSLRHLFLLFEDGNLVVEYIYNDEGQRTRKVVHNPDLTTTITIYHYDHMGYLITETTETGALIKDYIWEEGMHPIAQIDNTQGTEQVLYLYTDHLMTNRLATDQSQSVVWRWEGEAFGNTAADEIAGFSVNLRFPGQYFDQETNLHYNHFRYYDPQLGRYITSDPIGLSGGINTYLYVDANPLNFIDPTGEAGQLFFIAPELITAFKAACTFFGAATTGELVRGFLGDSASAKLKEQAITAQSNACQSAPELAQCPTLEDQRDMLRQNVAPLNNGLKKIIKKTTKR